MTMDDISTFDHHTTTEQLAEVLCARTEREAMPFFRTIAVYYMGIIASSMRARIVSPAFKDIPVNNYTVALATSGFGKGKGTGCMENEVLCDFKDSFRHYVMPALAEKNIASLANRYAAIHGTTEEAEEEAFRRDYNSAGEYLFAVDGGSEAYVKQIRGKLLLANCGALNLQIDEIGLNLGKPGTAESLASYLELYDTGRIKPKGKVNNNDNRRSRELDGSTPANMLLFGTPSKLFDGAKTERDFMAMLETGYARRCLFAWADSSTFVDNDEDIDVVYNRMVAPQNDVAIQTWRDHFASLANALKIGWTIESSEQADKLVLEYKADCRRRMKEMSQFDETSLAELEHRYFRVLKVAGTYAFIEESLVLTVDHVQAAIRLVEESGEAFQNMLKRDPVHVTLARYIASRDNEMTKHDLYAALPFFKGANKAEQDNFLSMAAAWGYDKHIVIKRRFVNNVEVYTGETLRSTSLDALILSYSQQFSHGYEPATAAFDELPNLTQLDGYHWSTHTFHDGHRCYEKAIPGFNMLVFDIDGGVPLALCHELLKDYVFMTYTTKSHSEEEDRYRLIIPTNYELKLDKDDYKELYRSVLAWLPFPASADTATVDMCRKWASHDGTYHQQTDGELFDVVPFIPKTKSNDDRVVATKPLMSMDNLERWFAQKWEDGNRNHTMIRYGLALVDSGLDYEAIQSKVLSFNSAMEDPLDVSELQHTVLVTVSKRIADLAA